MKTKRTKGVAFRTLHYFLQEVRRYKWWSAGMLITTPMVIFIRSALAPLILANIIGKVSSGEIPNDQLFATLMPEALIFLGVYLLSATVLEKLRLYFCWKMELKAMYNLAATCFTTLSTQTMQFHNDRFGGSLVSQTNKFIGGFERFVDSFIWNAFPLVCSIIFIFIILWPLAPLFAIFLAAFIIIYTSIAGVTFKRISYLNEEEASAQTRQTGQLADSITNILSVKSYGREAHERRRYANFQRSSFNAGMALLRSTIVRDIMFSFVSVGITAALIFFLVGGPAMFGISVATMVLIVTYSQQVLSNLWDINHVFKDFNRAFGDAYDMTKILDEVDLVKDASDAAELKVKKGLVEFNDVSFRHSDAKEAIFENFSLIIKPGQRIGLVGVSGSGKTTLTRLLLRFADVDSGSITIDGADIRDVTQVSLRENIAYVPQETALFHRTIAENIAYAKPEATPAQIKRAAELANADEFIKDLPNGYDTLVGERGVKLSGGQRQRVAIARAILKDAPILVLDEATSALDSESEALIQGALRQLMKDRTSLVIAHRLSTVAALDKIVVLKDGKIIEQGTHKQLIDNDGEYAKLWCRQTGAFLDTED
ncbi:ABC transporter ATP-binding protein/permease [Candidatus Saccharibacteria bacterium]|nr:ABC transporter ATP-binding protein/permease [Candidatus Saccharibacteria bacterium]